MDMRTTKIKIGILSVLFGCALMGNMIYGQSKQSQRLEALTEQINRKMQKHQLHGLSVAVFDDYKMIWSQQWGIKASGTTDKIDENTAFSTASTSKAIISMLCGILEEKGHINLDDPISKYLKRWQLPSSTYENSKDITWMQLLSHTAGTSQGGFADFYEGDKIPTILQSLKGELLPRYNKEIEFLFEPGTNWKYSGGGYVIIQMALEDHLNIPLADLVKRHVFDPLGLKNTTMKQPNEEGFLNNVAKVHNMKGEIIKTGLPITPQVAPSGMWSTPSDLAIIGIEMQNALRNQNNKVISHNVAKRIIKVASLDDVGGWSAGWNRSFGIGNRDWFSHGGSNTGVGGEFMATLEGGSGLAILANGDKPNRFPVMNFLRNQIVERCNWKQSINQKLLKKIPENVKNMVVGSYLDFLYHAPGVNKIFEEDGNLFISSPMFEFMLQKKKNQMYYVGNNTFKIEDYPNDIQFVTNSNSELKEIVIFRNQTKENKVVIQKEEVKNHKTQLIDAFSNLEIAAAKQEYKKIKELAPDLEFEAILNEFGYIFYMENNMKKAIAVLEFNREEHPDSWNTYDSLGEIYEVNGQFQKSVINYKKAQELNASKEYKERVLLKIKELERKSKQEF